MSKINKCKNCWTRGYEGDYCPGCVQAMERRRELAAWATEMHARLVETRHERWDGIDFMRGIHAKILEGMINYER